MGVSSKLTTVCDMCGKMCDEPGDVALSRDDEGEWNIGAIVGDEGTHICMDCAKEVYQAAVEEGWFQND